MLHWSLYNINDAIVRFVSQEKELEKDQLSASDWTTLGHIDRFLSNFKDATKATEGKNATTENVLVTMDFLCNQFEEAAALQRGDPFLTACIDAGYSKLLKYFNKKSRTPAYIAVVVFNPSLKWTFFDHWEVDDEEEAKHTLFKLWHEEYRTTTGLPEYPTPQKQTEHQFFQWITTKKACNNDNKDELQRYLDEGRVELGEGSAFEWSCTTTNRSSYPLLSRMAIDILSISAMSWEAERISSASKRADGETRWQLQADTFEALEC